MKPGLTSIFARPARLWTDQANAGAVGVVVDLPSRGEEHFDVFVREEIGSTVRSVDYADLPLAAVLRCSCFCQRSCFGDRCFLEVEDVSGAKNATRPAEFAKYESGAATEIWQCIKPSRDS